VYSLRNMVLRIKPASVQLGKIEIQSMLAGKLQLCCFLFIINCVFDVHFVQYF